MAGPRGGCPEASWRGRRPDSRRGWSPVHTAASPEPAAPETSRGAFTNTTACFSHVVEQDPHHSEKFGSTKKSTNVITIFALIFDGSQCFGSEFAFFCLLDLYRKRVCSYLCPGSKIRIFIVDTYPTGSCLLRNAVRNRYKKNFNCMEFIKAFFRYFNLKIK